ncbi:immunity protein [Lactobacillus amylovorus]|uniref:immunity protein n=1 Tax=Lactobacillus amylovorus TaxID=1604 RepID=UPI0023304C8A|nr:immunity protein [Lactobacillus amylovorus]
MYTGKIRVPMLFHLANDFLNYAQVGGMTAQTWRGDANDWLNLVPIAITIWMLTGQRRLVMEQNIMRLLEK